MSTRSPSIASDSRASNDAGPATASGAIRVGIGGWTYEPWRNNFYPPGHAHSRELEFASRQVSVIEINATYYRTQSPQSFAKWRDATPTGFMFAVKASRYCTNRSVLGEAGESIERFVASGIAELGPKLAPLVWQLAPSKRFEPDDCEAFFKLLPASVGGLRLRHAIEVRHPSFMVPEFLALAQRYRVATVFADSAEYPSFADLTADFVYGRLMQTEATHAAGYAPERIAFWADCAKKWAAGEVLEGVPRVQSLPAPAVISRDVFLLFISGAKERAPAAAMATLHRLGLTPQAL